MADRDEAQVVISATRVTRRKHGKRAARFGWAAAFLGLLPMIVIMIGTVFFPGGGKPWWAEHLMLSWLGAAGMGFAALRALGNPWGQAAVVDKEGDEIRFSTDAEVPDKTWSVKADGIVHGTVIPGYGARLQAADGEMIDVEVESTRDAERLIAACDLSPPDRRFTTAFASSPLRAVLGIAGVIGLLAMAVSLAPSVNQLTKLDAALWFASAIAFFGVTSFGMKPPKVEVGADGVAISTRFGERFLRFEEIETVSVEGTTLTLALHDGDPVTVRAAAGNASQQQALRHRIEMGMAAHAEAPEAPARLALLDRKERPVTAWRDELDQAVNDDTGYRRQPLSRDDLEAILASSKTSTERRIGAALALQALDGEEAGPRIRIAAEDCAESRARQALLRIAEGELEHRAVEEALEVSERREDARAR